MNKKRQRKEKNKKNKKSKNEINSSNDSIEEEEFNYNDNNNNSKDNEKDLFNCVFIFSCIIPDYFLMIKNLLLPNFISENISLNGLTDLVICMREDIGTTLKIENDDEDKIFGVFTLIPFPYYKENPVVLQIINMLLNKINNLNIVNIIKNGRIGLLINERFVNLPEELIAPALNFVINEMDECIEINNDKSNKNIDNKEKNKYNLDYIIVYSRYVIKENKAGNEIKVNKDMGNSDNCEQMEIDDDKYINLVIKENKNKKPKLEKNDEIVYYKYEIENFMKKADYYFDYKLTGGIYDSSCIYINQNNNEIQYMKIVLIKFQKFYEVIRELNKK